MKKLVVIKTDVKTREQKSTLYKKSSSSLSSYNTSVKTYSKGDYLLVSSMTLNLRVGPGTKYKIVEKLNYQATLIVMESFGTWIKVKIKNTEIIGYVYYKYVNK